MSHTEYVCFLQKLKKKYIEFLVKINVFTAGWKDYLK